MPKAPTVIALARDLLLFRARPQDLPFSPALLFHVDRALHRLRRPPPSGEGKNASVLSAVLASHALRVLLFAMFFAWRGILPRLIKSLTALWLSDLAFRVLLLPLVLIMAGASDGVAPAAPSALVELAVLAVPRDGDLAAHGARPHLAPCASRCRSRWAPSPRCSSDSSQESCSSFPSPRIPDRADAYPHSRRLRHLPWLAWRRLRASSAMKSRAVIRPSIRR